MSFDINPLDDQPDPHGECAHEICSQLSAIGSLLDEAGIPDGGSTVTRVAMLVAARDEAVKLIDGAFK